MRRDIRLIAAALALSLPVGVSAAPGDIRVTFMAASRDPWPWSSQPGEGVVHAFTCISLDLAAGIKEDCYGFYPAVPIAKVTFANGSVLSRRNDGSWIEGNGPFTFQKKASINPGELTLYDAKRDFYWQIPKSGVSSWKQGNGGWNPYLIVVGFEADGSFLGSIKGPGSVYSEFEKAPSRFANAEVSVSKIITPAQRSQMISEVAKWQNGTYGLTLTNCIDLVDDLIKVAGLTPPQRGTFQTPVSYLKAVQAKNP